MLLHRLIWGTVFLIVGLAIAGGIALGLRSRMFQIMPLPLRAAFRAVGLVVGGVLLSAMLLLAVLAYAGGGIGDPGYSMIVGNDADSTLTFFVSGIGETKDSAVFVGVTLGPGVEFVDHWVRPMGESGESPATVRAIDVSGATVFCRQFSYSDLKARHFEIRLTRSGSTCP
jgi:hypothetical protein